MSKKQSKSSTANPDYYRCWAKFLAWINMREFRRVMTEAALENGVTVTQWPTVWPSVEQVFSDKADYSKAVDRFVAAVQKAEKTI